jgi:hypothetical protein
VAGKKAVKTGEVTATAGTTMYSPAVKGSWLAGPVIPTSYSKLKSGGGAVLSEAKCTFSFTGTGPTPAEAPVSGTSTVTLSAQTTRLQKGASNVLVDGESKKDEYGNELKASAQGKLSTS